MTDPDDEYCDCEPDPAGIELPSGWTLVAPPGTSREALEYAAKRLDDDEYLPSVDDAEGAVEIAAARDMFGPVTEHQHMVNELLVDTINRTLGWSAWTSDYLFRGPPKAQRFGTVVYDTVNPSDPGHSWVKDRFMPAGTRLSGGDHTDRWEPWDGDPVDTTRWHAAEFTVYAGDDIARALRWDLADQLTEDTHALIQDWAQNPPARPGWTGTLTGPPLPIPLKLTPWQTLPKGVSDGGRTIIIEPGADADPDARLMKLEYGRWRDVGPAYPHGIAPAHRGRPAPIPWDSPLADPIADMRRITEETP